MELTAKQRKFARLVADGMPRTKAYEETYGSNGGKQRTRQVAAQKAGAVPQVREAIAEYQAEALPPIGDLRKVREEMLANIRWLAREATDQRVRLAASIDLRNYIDERERHEQARLKPLTIDTLITEIRALDAPAPTLEMESVEDAEPAAVEESPVEESPAEE